MPKDYPETLERGTTALKCECGGYCEKVVLEEAERIKGTCMKNHILEYGCCLNAFVCVLCKTRWLANVEAPEID